MNKAIKLINEFNNEIVIRVVLQADQSIVVEATGPTSQVVHTWTMAEARVLSTLLKHVIEDVDYLATLNDLPN